MTAIAATSGLQGLTTTFSAVLAEAHAGTNTSIAINVTFEQGSVEIHATGSLEVDETFSWSPAPGVAGPANPQLGFFASIPGAPHVALSSIGLNGFGAFALQAAAALSGVPVISFFAPIVLGLLQANGLSAPSSLTSFLTQLPGSLVASLLPRIFFQSGGLKTLFLYDVAQFFVLPDVSLPFLPTPSGVVFGGVIWPNLMRQPRLLLQGPSTVFLNPSSFDFTASATFSCTAIDMNPDLVVHWTVTKSSGSLNPPFVWSETGPSTTVTLVTNGPGAGGGAVDAGGVLIHRPLHRCRASRGNHYPDGRGGGRIRQRWLSTTCQRQRQVPVPKWGGLEQSL